MAAAGGRNQGQAGRRAEGIGLRSRQDPQSLAIFRAHQRVQEAWLDAGAPQLRRKVHEGESAATEAPLDASVLVL
jgi:hypothetical protein